MNVTDKKREVADYLDQHRDDVTALMREMIRTKSINVRLDPSSPGEARMAELVQAEWNGLGLEVETVVAEPGRPNTIATWKGEGGGPRLLFNAHVDTVAVKDGDTWIDPETGETKHEWSVDPFGAEIIDGYLYGRGACDHKSPNCSLIWAVRALQACGARLKGDLVVINDVDEETGGVAGMRHIASTRPFNCDIALFGTTTEFTPKSRPYFSAIGDVNIIRAFSGMHLYKVSISGKNYHSMTPLHGVTAAENLARVLPAVEEYIARVNARVDPIVGTGKPPMRLLNVSGRQRAAHRGADVVELLISRRIDPTVNPDQALDDLREIARRLTDPEREIEISVEVTRNVPPNEVPADNPLITSLARAVRDTQGEEPTIGGIPAATGISQMLGIQKIPVVTFAYGALNFHHAIDERIPVEAMTKTAQVYAAALMDYLGLAD